MTGLEFSLRISYNIKNKDRNGENTLYSCVPAPQLKLCLIFKGCDGIQPKRMSSHFLLYEDIETLTALHTADKLTIFFKEKHTEQRERA